MGAEQAASVLATVKRSGVERRGGIFTDAEEAAIKAPIVAEFDAQSQPLYASARLWDDGIIDPVCSRDVIGLSLAVALNAAKAETRFGVFRM